MPICRALDLLSIAIEAPKIKEEHQQDYATFDRTEAAPFGDFFYEYTNAALDELMQEEDRYFLDLANA